MGGWTPDELPDLSGKTYAVTGGNSGLGLEASRILAAKGAKVVFTSRSADKAEAARATILAAAPGADVSWVPLDLADPASVAHAADALLDRCPRLDAVINNAGVMQPPLIRTSEGFELQLATNHVGHVRLNARLLPRLEEGGGRIVVVSSIAHRMGRLDLDDLMFERRPYDPTVAYAQSKLANLVYALELHRRLTARGSRVTAIPCHPGYAATNLQSAGVGMEGGSALLRAVYKVTNAVVAQSAERGAWPLALAAADPKAEAGVYYGPTWFGDARGPVGRSAVSATARDEALGAGLWEATERLAGPFFPA